MSDMNDKELIGYCDVHCKTERALFYGEHINRMIKLAGNPEEFVDSVKPDMWLSAKEEMQELCDLARGRIMLKEINLDS